MDSNRIKLYVLTGFLGAGKTSLLLHLLDAMEGRKIGIIQNEFGKLKRERPVILVDQTGAGSRPVARLLRGVGFQRVTILERGIVGWLQAKMPLE